ncbi:MAG: hypothetical protein NC548_64955 [Lachnospiraceae bacterium]|nr:hypothetical protein [Lachnospiraceae bacterium]
MIRQRIYLPKIDWSIDCFYAVTRLNVDEVMRSLERAGCREKNLRTAYENLTRGDLNTGLCFTGDGRSVLVTSLTSSGGELANSLVHELHHLATQIGNTLGYDLMGEEVCYIAGDIAKEMYNVAGKYLCEGCRSKGRYYRLP